MKKINLFFIAICAIFCFTSCEKEDIDFNTDVETRLTDLLGEEIGPVANTLKAEGFTRMDIEHISSFVKNDEAYNFASNTKKPKTIYSAGYQYNDGESAASKKYEDYRNSLILKSGVKYEGRIAAENFTDLSEGYTDKELISGDLYYYTYDDPMKFKMAYDFNSANLIQSTESWWKGERYKDEMWTIELVSGTNKRRQVGFICSDYTLFVK